MKIVIVEDDIKLREELKILLDNKTYQGIIIKNFNNLEEDILNVNPDLILLDINIPNISGEILLKKLRAKTETPIIMVTSKNTEVAEVLCMSYGADDFITKPYNPTILLLHIEAIFKRVNKISKILNYEDLEIDIYKSQIKRNNKVIELSKNEIRILSLLINNRGKIVSREEIINYLWDSLEFIDENTLTVNINRLRKKLEDIGLKDVIKTRRSEGYIIL